MKPYLFYGLFQRHQCLLPTWRGLFLIVFVGAGFLLMAVLNVQPFLALTEPVPAQVLVVEGWVPDYVLEKAALEFNRGNYSKLFVTGGPLEKGGMFSGHKTHAELGAAILIGMGIGKNAIEAVPAPPVLRDRTYASALALKSWLHERNPGVTSLNLVSVGVHARRSHLLFQKAFDDGLRVGIIAVEDRNYSGERWWKFSAGVRAVMDELFAYIYALLVFPLVEP